MSGSVAPESMETEPKADASPRISSDPARAHGDPAESTKPEASQHRQNGTFWADQQERDQHRAYCEAANIVHNYSDEMIKQWVDEIDSLLLFAGLYSAILTAFNVQSYPYLQPSGPDPTVAILQQISLQLNSFTSSPPFVNSTHIASFATDDQIRSRPDAWVVTLNVLWFSALILSLTSASVAIMVKQWIREYQSGCSGTSTDISLIRLRQYRLNNLVQWRVGDIVVILPVLLQGSLFLFFAGLLVLLWNFHSTVAIVASALVAVTSLVFGLTFLPIFCTGCPYWSPATHALLSAIKYAVIVAELIIVALYIPVLLAAVFLEAIAIRLGAPHLQFCSWTRSSMDRMVEFGPRESKGSIFWRRGENAIVRPISQLHVDLLTTSYAATTALSYIIGMAVVLLIGQDPTRVIELINNMERIKSRHNLRFVTASTDISLAFLQQLPCPFNTLRVLDKSNLVAVQCWTNRLSTIFKTQGTHEQGRTIFILSAAVVASGPKAGVALEGLLRLFHDERGTGRFRGMSRHFLGYVLIAMKTSLRWHLQNRHDPRLDIALEPTTSRQVLDALRSLSCEAGWSGQPTGQLEKALFSEYVFELSSDLARVLFTHARDSRYIPRNSSAVEYKLQTLRDTLEVLRGISWEDPLCFTFDSKPEFLKTLAASIQSMENTGTWDRIMIGNDIWRDETVKLRLQSLKDTVDDCRGVRAGPSRATGNTPTMLSDPGPGSSGNAPGRGNATASPAT